MVALGAVTHRSSAGRCRGMKLFSNTAVKSSAPESLSSEPVLIVDVQNFGVVLWCGSRPSTRE